MSDEVQAETIFSFLIPTKFKCVWLTSGVAHARRTIKGRMQALRIHFCKMVLNGLRFLKVLVSIKRDNKRNSSSTRRHTLSNCKVPLTPIPAPAPAEASPSTAPRQRPPGASTGPQGPLRGGRFGRTCG